jgi:hypothetical protein
MDDLQITAEYDEDAHVWVAVEDRLGLATEAESLDVLGYKLQEMIPELAELNHWPGPRPISFTLVSKRKLEAFA